MRFPPSSLGFVLLAVACQDSPPGTNTAPCAEECPPFPRPLFTLLITTSDGASLPGDTSIEVTWGGGHVERFELDDPGTWSGLEGNLVCDVDHDAGGAYPQDELACSLYTTDAQQVLVRASGYQPFVGSYGARKDPVCGCEQRSDVPVELVPLEGGIDP